MNDEKLIKQCAIETVNKLPKRAIKNKEQAIKKLINNEKFRNKVLEIKKQNETNK